MKASKVKKKYNSIFFVLPGGGTRAAFQWGAIRYLQEMGIEADEVFGISAGALNSVFVGTKNYEMGDEVWFTIKQTDIFKGSPYLRFLTLQSSLYDATPLYKLITEYAKIAQFKVPTHVVAVSLKDGKAHTFRHDDENFHRAVLASSALPIIFQPVHFDGQYWVDGGIRDISPMKWVFNREKQPDLIVTISVNPNNLDTFRKLPSRIDIIELIKFFLPEAINSLFKQDMQKFEQINETLKQIEEQDSDFEYVNPKTGEPYQYFDYLNICPEEELGEFLDFNRSHLDSLIKRGYDRAEQELNELKYSRMEKLNE